jgi:hypothetical protein
VDADAGVAGTQMDGESVMEAGESIVGADVINSCIVDMQTDGKSAVDTGIDAMDMQM